jgi:hypothetical protein
MIAILTLLAGELPGCAVICEVDPSSGESDASWDVKFYLTESQGLSLLCTGGRPGHLRRPASVPPVKTLYAEEPKAEYRKALGVPPESLIDAFGPREAIWWKELDPCRRAMARLEVEQREIYQYRREAVDESTQERFQAEAPIHAGDIPRNDLSSESARFDALNEAFVRFGAPLGFRRNPALSRKLCPVYCREISEEWACFTWSITPCITADISGA